MIKETKFSIVIPHINEWYFLNIMLDSFYNHIKYQNYEIIIVDDGSKEIWDLDFLDTHFLKDKINLFKESNLGCAWSKNFGASKASWDILFFLDSHMYVNSDILQYTSDIMVSARSAPRNAITKIARLRLCKRFLSGIARKSASASSIDG